MSGKKKIIRNYLNEEYIRPVRFTNHIFFHFGNGRYALFNYDRMKLIHNPEICIFLCEFFNSDQKIINSVIEQWCLDKVSKMGDVINDLPHSSSHLSIK
jgi:hypothetical protein